MSTRARASDPAEWELARRLHAAALHLLRRLRREDRAAGLSPARLSTMSVLVFGGERTLSELAAAEQVSAPTMSRMVAALEAAGLVERRAGARDRRTIHLRATAAGRRLLEEGRARREGRLIELLGPVSEEERATLAAATAILERILGE